MGIKGLTEALGIGHDEAEDIVHWQEFRKGTYNYPISFPIPTNTPPTVHGDFGTVIYKLKAVVVRAGALSPNLIEEMEVTMIATPQEDDLEETENVLVERQWEEQMRYQIALGGKAFPVGGLIPMGIRLMPLAKCKIHRITVALEEKADYYAQKRQVARHENPRRFVLAFYRQNEKKERDPLLPIISEDPDAARNSPLAPLALHAARSDAPGGSSLNRMEEDDMYASLMDPLGPWHLETDLKIPDCRTKIRFTARHERTNINISHSLKVTIRVERGDEADEGKGRKKQFDIIIETPIKILDCRVNTQWNSLPTYAAVNPTTGIPPITGCTVHSRIPIPRLAADPIVSSTPQFRNISLAPMTLHHRRDSSASRSSSVPRVEEDTLLERNIVYDRLMSGQITETGEVPPSYGEAMASTRRRTSSSVSRLGRGMSPSPLGLGRARSRAGSLLSEIDTR
ncbi:hypothetical protein TREMEDRAFT_42980 [Tremella mesenterica DSM 1558]|nr:uncharacterized protein TREMEDRAFT_42980 [Tremella mesenterica DSM 1558]EIW71659.1 hypothetical protein TREMEDRAFT_42980 [Tremella mesenterica DSM 1558]